MAQKMVWNGQARQSELVDLTVEEIAQAQTDAVTSEQIRVAKELRDADYAAAHNFLVAFNFDAFMADITATQGRSDALTGSTLTQLINRQQRINQDIMQREKQMARLWWRLLKRLDETSAPDPG